MSVFWLHNAKWDLYCMCSVRFALIILSQIHIWTCAEWWGSDQAIGDLMLFWETNKGELYTPRIMWLAQIAYLVGPGCKLKHFTEWTWGNDEISVRATATGVLVSMCVCLLTWTQNRNTSRDFHLHRYMNLSLHLLVLLVHRQTLSFC